MQSNPPTHWQPGFPGFDTSAQIHVRIDIHLDGPAGRGQVWLTIRDPETDGLFVCKSLPVTDLDQVVETAIRAVHDGYGAGLERLLPF